MSCKWGGDMYCSNCGARMSDENKFCTRCGKPAINENKIMPPISDYSKTNNKKNKTTRRLIIILSLIVAILLVCCIVIIVYLLSDGDAGKAEKQRNADQKTAGALNNAVDDVFSNEEAYAEIEDIVPEDNSRYNAVAIATAKEGEDFESLNPEEVKNNGNSYGRS